MDKYLPKIKSYSKKLLGCIAVFFLFSIVLDDLDRPGEGYIKWVTFGTLAILKGCLAEMQEISNKPLASLTIVNLITLFSYCYAVVFLFIVGKFIWSWISDYFEECDRNQFEINREIWLQKEKERLEEAVLYSGESSERCHQTVIEMENAETLDELQSIYEYATQNWPKWSNPLSKVYQKRKKWLEKNKPDSKD